MHSKSVVRGHVDGNIFVVLGAARSAMKKDWTDEADIVHMSTRVINSGSYHEALSVIMEYVDFVGLD